MTQEQAFKSFPPEVSRLAAGFETQWRTGPRPHISEFISLAPLQARRSVLIELIGLDAVYRRRAGEHPSVDDYQDKFPELSPEELDQAVTVPPVRNSTTTAVTEGDSIIAAGAFSSSSSPGRFKKIEEIGRGGMGSVWRAVQMSTGREVALKELPADALKSFAARSRFEEEIHWASLLQHPNIARVYDSGLLEGSYVYAMELIQGEHLDEYARKSRWTLRQMLEMMALIARAMQYAHTRNVLHLDLKPSNIMVASEGKPIIVDFGLARLARKTPGDKEPRYGDVIGTPAFMAPEQAMGREDLIGYPTDVYSLGVILYRFLTGRFPLKPQYTVHAWQQQLSEHKAQAAREKDPRIGHDLNALIDKCLAPNPADRYADAGELALDIDCLLQGTELRARPLNRIGRLKSWCSRPARLLQAGNITSVIGIIMAPFHIAAIFISIAAHWGFPITGFGGVRLGEFIPLMAGFLIFDAWLIFTGLMERQDRVWALWTNTALGTAWLFWFILVLSGVVRFDTAGAVPNMDVRLPIYIIFSGFAASGLVFQCLAIYAHYARAFLNEPLPADQGLKQITGS